MTVDPLYSAQEWVDGPGGGTPLSAERLNNLELGVSSALIGTNDRINARADAVFVPSAAGSPTTDTANVQAALNAAAAHAAAAANSSAFVDLKGRVWLCADLEWPTHVGIQNGTLKLKNAANVPLISTTGYSALVGTNSTAGVRGISWHNVTFDGNKANQTVAADLVRIYGCAFSWSGYNSIHDSKGRGLVSEWSNDLASPDGNGMESFGGAMAIHHNALGGMYWNGPHDTKMTGLTSHLNGVFQIHIGPKGNATVITAGHAWGLGADHCYILDATGCQLDGCQGEGASVAQVWIRGTVGVPANDTQITGGKYFRGGSAVDQPAAKGIVFGSATIHPSGCFVGTALANFDSGAIDWVGDPGGNWVMGTIYQTTGAEYAGTPHEGTVRMIAMSGRSGAVSDFHVRGRARLEGLDVAGNLTVVSSDFNLKVETLAGVNKRTRLAFLAAGVEQFSFITDRNADGGHDMLVYDAVNNRQVMLFNNSGVVGFPQGIGLGNAVFPGTAGAQTGWLPVYDPSGTTIAYKIPVYDP